ncbi:hypothetical protein DUNSADRAFT_9692 [Dunaliella salina]|uniref:Mannose-P-dolichol utilization defect 1 protein n=1 Tax=Dunaliella salina TaxID=3046 RepID=A0ABQ7GDV8_DUNSA|nr:hypothetical protein DUNSADRAFT_9692 [Dunaliella salina]|eukprot:KAF5833855.1 hypothetical protein DUNSADRAFT_9692 [Dunaliella salina]
MEWRPSFNLGNYLGTSSLLKGTSLIKPSLAPSAAVQPLRRYIPVQLSACMDMLATASASLARRGNLASGSSSSSASSSTPGSLGPSATAAAPAPHTTPAASPNSTTPLRAHAHPSRRRRTASSATLLSRRNSGALQSAALDGSSPPPHPPSQASAMEAAASAPADTFVCAEQGQHLAHIAASPSAAPAPSQQQQQQHQHQQELHVQQGQQAWREEQLHGSTSLPTQTKPTPLPMLSTHNTAPPQPPTNGPCDSDCNAAGWTGAEAVEPTSEQPPLSLMSFYQSLEAALAEMQASCAQLLQTEACKGDGAWLGMWGAELQGPERGEAATEPHDPLLQGATCHLSGLGAAAATAGLATSAAAYNGFSPSPPSLSKPPPWRSPLRSSFKLPSLETGTAAAAAAGPVVSTKAVAVVLGYAVLIGSCFRSLPQILKGYAFNTYGEVFACWLQDIVLVALIFRHTNTPLPFAAAAGGVFALLCSYLFQPGACPLHILGFLQLSSVFIMALGSRIPQIMLNVRRGNAGMMSLTTCLLNVAGNTTRIFTTLVLTKDMYILSACSTQFVLNSILLWQCISTRRAAKQQRLHAEAAAVEHAGAGVGEGSKHGIQEGLQGAQVNHSGEEGYNKGGGSSNAGGYPQPQPA